MKRHLALAMAAAAMPVTATLTPGDAMATPGPAGPAGPVPLKTITVTESTPFTSPSGNIGCYLGPEYVRCDIRERSWSPPPKAADCPDYTGWGQGIQLSDGRPAAFVCAGDTALTTGNPLAYGDTMVAGSIECTSSPAGITCWDFQYGGEFSISREAYHLA